MQKVYAEAGDRPLSNDELYDGVGKALGMSRSEFRRRRPVGQARTAHSPLTRTARWTQQTMRARNWLERVPKQRGVWQLTKEGRQRLHTPAGKRVLIGFSTRLGVALVGDCRDSFAGLGEPVSLCLTSPPYPLARPRLYGNPKPEEYVDFLCSCMEVVVKWLAPGGSAVLIIGQDCFETGSPARSIFLERLVVALHDRLGLQLMDRLIWKSNKPVGPVAWASVKRYQLAVSYEFAYWFCNDASRVMSDNRRVLLPHTARHQRFIASGGERRQSSSSDGAYTLRKGSFSNPTPGRIPRNVLEFGNACASQRRYKARAAELGLTAHGAPVPKALIRFLVSFLSEEGHLVVDPMAGSQTLAEVCEELGRPWVTSELFGEYVRGGAERVGEDVWINPLLDALCSNRGPQGQLFG